MCDWADTVNSQMIDGVKMTMIEACKALELETVASMPFAMGEDVYKRQSEGLPVLYLQHGFGESEISWTTTGKANIILDNLIEMCIRDRYYACMVCPLCIPEQQGSR